MGLPLDHTSEADDLCVSYLMDTATQQLPTTIILVVGHAKNRATFENVPTANGRHILRIGELPFVGGETVIVTTHVDALRNRES